MTEQSPVILEGSDERRSWLVKDKIIILRGDFTPSEYPKLIIKADGIFVKCAVYGINEDYLEWRMLQAGIEGDKPKDDINANELLSYIEKPIFVRERVDKMKIKRAIFHCEEANKLRERNEFFNQVNGFYNHISFKILNYGDLK